MTTKSVGLPQLSQGSATSMSLIIIGFCMIFGGILGTIVIFGKSPPDFRSASFLVVVGPAISIVAIGLMFTGLGELINNSESILRVLMRQSNQQNKET